MIEINNKTYYRLPRKLILNTVAHTVKYLKINTSYLSVVFVTPAIIKKLNLEYRQQDKITDVLSFSYFYNKKKLDGEIIICYSVAVKQAKKFKHSVSQEINKLLVHSLLHLIGYDHQTLKQAKQMEHLEDDILECLKTS